MVLPKDVHLFLVFDFKSAQGVLVKLWSNRNFLYQHVPLKLGLDLLLDFGVVEVSVALELVDPDLFAVVHVLGVYVADMLPHLLDRILEYFCVFTGDLDVAYLEVLDVPVEVDVGVFDLVPLRKVELAILIVRRLYILEVLHERVLSALYFLHLQAAEHLRQFNP